MDFKKLLFVSLLFICSVAYAAPSITSIDKNLTASSHNVTFVITGTSFGTKATAAPLKWENFNNGVHGNAVTTGGYWSSDGTSPVYNNTNLRANSTLNMKAVLAGARDCIYKENLDFSSNRIYIDFWVRFDRGTGDSDYQIKLWRIQDTNTTADYPSIANFNWGNASSGRWYYYQITRDDLGISTSGKTINFYPNLTWAHIQFECEVESAVSASDGKIRIWNNCFLDVNTTNENMVTSAGENFGAVRFGEYIGNGGTTTTNYFDNIYIDNSFSRVEIGNSSIYGNCNHRETQIPSAWSTTSITFTGNMGSFTPDSENVYLFVIDSDGSVSSGLSISGAGGGGADPDTTKPSVTGKNPISGASSVSKTSNVIFHLEDYESGVDLSSLNLSISGVHETDYSNSGNANDYTITMANADINTAFSPAMLVDVGVVASDLSGNTVAETWSFTIADDTLKLGGQTLKLGGQTLKL